jgi:hypothetical protein
LFGIEAPLGNGVLLLCFCAMWSAVEVSRRDRFWIMKYREVVGCPEDFDIGVVFRSIIAYLQKHYLRNWCDESLGDLQMKWRSYGSRSEGPRKMSRQPQRSEFLV